MRAYPILLLLICSNCFADPIFQFAAPTGAWVKFEGTLTIDKGEQPVRYLVKSGEVESRGGQELQWIELLALDTKVQEEKTVVKFRLLIPSAEFGEGKDPLANATEVTAQFGEEPPRSILGIAEIDPPFAFALSGPGESEPLPEPEVVDWQGGKLSCTAFNGESTQSLAGLKYEMQHHILRHKEVPFQVASVRQETTAVFGSEKRTAVLAVQIVDFGRAIPKP